MTRKNKDKEKPRMEALRANVDRPLKQRPALDLTGRGSTSTELLNTGYSTKFRQVHYLPHGILDWSQGQTASGLH